MKEPTEAQVIENLETGDCGWCGGFVWIEDFISKRFFCMNCKIDRIEHDEWLRKIIEGEVDAD